MSRPSSNLSPYLINGGTIETINGGQVRLKLPSNCDEYCDAQLDDYQTLPRKQFNWTPPCRLEMRARASSSHPPGTLGFGFWNDPFTLSLGQGGAARRFPAMPQTLWFFYGSRENDIRLDPSLPGSGWKASCLRSPPLPVILLAPIAPLAFGASYFSILRSFMMKAAGRIITVDEVLLEDELDQWHNYSLDWGTNQAVFSVDGKCVHTVLDPPIAPLGFVVWIDNQFATASPDENFKFGVTQTQSDQWLDIELINLSRT